MAAISSFYQQCVQLWYASDDPIVECDPNARAFDDG